MQKSQPRNIFRFENLLQNRLYLFCWDNWLESPVWIISEPRCLLGYQNTVIFELLKFKKRQKKKKEATIRIPPTVKIKNKISKGTK